ncbi:MAG: glutamine-hydrolyzing GMP synthase [Candidatus Marinimicrobia bacterium]|nr:glutamine-hydrolyzing GMP synthase [Candidatus Neomarinimicrobiota bacterium]|tara:strand:+ start:5011 stop:6561 length:1551 start_codon:yes stop_codon:yes gene_type:complete
MKKSKTGGVLILDFGSQYTQLIARRVRENNVYSEILPSNTSLNSILSRNPKAIILSGGPSSVFSEDAPDFDKEILNIQIPILGICYGLQLLVHHSGGTVDSTGEGEYGFATIKTVIKNGITKNMSRSSKVWMSHMDQVTVVPDEWVVVAFSSNNIIAAIASKDQMRVATQFHPEVSQTDEGHILLKNFLFHISKCEKNWTAGNFVNEKVISIKDKIGNDKILVGVSGGVDSTVVASLINKAVGNKCFAVLIDHGLLRKNEAKDCVNALKQGLGMNIHLYDESELFFSRLKGVEDPEQKRKIIGDQFIKSFDRIASEIGKFKFLGQGTLYPDLIESGVSAGKSAHVIKSHHNVGGLPDQMNFDLIEPLKDLFKDEVRKVGIALKITDDLVKRHPFPGPGLGVRIIGEITKERVSILQEADEIFINILKEELEYDNIWQAFAVLIPVKTVGVMGDQRTYENLIALRAVTSLDGMTADWYRMPSEILSKISNKIVNNVIGVNRVVYDITSKPPSTIEWE